MKQQYADIVRQRRIADEGLDRALFESFYNQLKKNNIVVEKGIPNAFGIDATIKEAQATHHSKRDKDADFTRKREKTYYGYKGHIAIDEESEVIKKLQKQVFMIL